MSVRAVVVLLAAIAACVVVLSVGHRSAPTPPAPSRIDASALQLLHSWDERRAAAYAAGSARALSDLYVPGSAAGRADLRVLRDYRARALRVAGMRMQVLAVSVLASRPGRRRLQVTDQLVGAVAVRGRRRLPLPRDRPSTRALTLMRGSDGRWRVADVTDSGV